MNNSINNFRSNTDQVIFKISVTYFLLTLILPFFAQITNAHLTMVITCFLLIIIMFANIDKYVAFVIPLSGLLILDIINSILNNPTDTFLILYRKIIWLLPAIISFFLISNNNKKLIKMTLRIIIFGLLITSITSYFALLNDPFASRIAATIGDSKDEYAVYLNMKNIGGFAIVYQIVIIYPMVIALFKHKKISLLKMSLLSIGYGSFVFMSQYATATILFICSLIPLILTKKFKEKKLMVMGITMIFTVYLFKPLIGYFLYFLSNNIESAVLSKRFTYLADSFSGVDVLNNDVGNRFLLYKQSFDVFKKHPVMGGWLFDDGMMVGGHSFILDVMGNYGLIGMVLLIIFYMHIIKKFYVPLRNQPFFGYMLYSLILSIILGVLNPLDSLMSIALIVPLAGYMIRNELEYTN